MSIDGENLLNIGAAAFLTLLETKKEQAVGRLIQKYRAGEPIESTASELSVYFELITSFKQRLLKQKANEGVPNV